MLNQGHNKRRAVKLLACAALLVSQVSLADPAKLLSGSNAAAGAENGSATLAQSVIKSTDANEITIKLDNTPAELALAQNTQLDSVTKATEVMSAEQAGLFRIYRSNLLKKTYQHVIYPESAIDRNQQGDVILKLTITRDGKIKDVQYDSRADFSSLNKAAARAVKNAKPYPAAPKRLHGESFEVIMPIKFRLAG